MGTVRSNIWKVYAYKFLCEFYLIAPILIPYYKSNGLNATQVFTIQAAYALSILVFEIPSGYLADVIGRKKTLLLGAVFFPVGISVYAFTGSFATFVLAEFILAFANSMRSGCDSAFLYDSLVEMTRQTEYKKIEGRSYSIARVGSSVSSVLGGVLAVVAIRLPFYINIATGLLMLPVVLSMVEPKRLKLESPHPLRDILRVCRTCVTQPTMRLLILQGALIMTSGIIGLWAYFLYYDSVGIPVGAYGVLFAVFQLSSAFGSSKAHALEKRFGLKRTLFMSLAVAPVFVLLGWVRSPFLIPLICLNAFLWGMTYPLLLDALNRRTSSDVRATTLSTANMAGSVAYVLLSPLFGRIVDLTSLSTAFILLGVFFAVAGSAILAAVIPRLRAEEQPPVTSNLHRSPPP